MGEVAAGGLLVVVHTYDEGDPERVRVRIISARPATKREAAQYRERHRMRDEYDFGQARRGRFARPDAVLVPPVRLEPDVLDYLAKRAAARGVGLDQLVNELLRQDIERIEAAG